MTMPKIFLFTTLIGLTVSVDAFGWSAVGHEVVAQIAENILTARDAARHDGRNVMREIQSILEVGPCSGENLPPDPQYADVDFGGPNLSHFVQSAIWLDDARSMIAKAGAALGPADVPFATSAGWHFVNLPFDAERSSYDIKNVCVQGGCAADKIEEYFVKLVALRGDSGTDATAALNKCRALKTVVHLVGDLHQPLHAIDFNSDHGGNARQVNFYQGAGGNADAPRLTNLHSLWDSGLLKDILKREGKAQVKTLADELTRELDAPSRAATVAGRMPFAVLSPFQALTRTIKDWAWESHTAAVYAYQDETGEHKGPQLPPLEAGGVDATGRPKPPTAAPFDVKRGYEDAAELVLREQLKKGGLRLADLLDKAFKD